MDSVWDTACAVGCPIRRFTDQSLLAAPRDLSQRAASFIASQCQGIHQMPFRRLISRKRRLCATRRNKPAQWHSVSPPFQMHDLNHRYRAAEVCPRSLALHLHLSMIPPQSRKGERRNASACALALPTYPVLWFLPTILEIRRLICHPQHQPQSGWWRQTGSNRRHPACKAGALPTELCPQTGAKRTRLEKHGGPGRI